MSARTGTDDDLEARERQLSRARDELASLETELVTRELDVASLQAELRVFERHYLEVVGAQYARLEALEARIVASQRKADPATEARPGSTRRRRGAAAPIRAARPGQD